MFVNKSSIDVGHGQPPDDPSGNPKADLAQTIHIRETIEMGENLELAGILLEPNLDILERASLHVRPGQNLNVGRGSATDLQVSVDKWMSRQHFSIACHDDQGILTDLHSSNGTLLNGESIDEANLCDGDKIAAGSTEFKIRFLRQLKTDRRA